MLKPGWKTTEFWATTFTGLVATVTDALAACGVAFNDKPVLQAVPVAASLAAAVAAHGYSGSRAKVKEAASWAQESAAPVAAAAAVVPAPPSDNLGVALNQFTDPDAAS